MNFKIAIIAVFFFFLLFELHSPIFKPAATGYVPRSIGHQFDGTIGNKLDETSGCECPQGTYVMFSTETSCDCWDQLYEVITTVDRNA